MSKKANSNWKLEKVAEKIIEKIEAGEIDPWKKPFGFGQDRARNLKSKQPYRGMNSWLSCVGRYFLSMKEASELHAEFSHYNEVEKKTRAGKKYMAEVPIDKAGNEMKTCKGLSSYPVWFKKNRYFLDDKEIKWADVLKLMDKCGVDSFKELQQTLKDEGKVLRSTKIEVLYNVFNVDELPKEGNYERLFPEDEQKEIVPIRECLNVLRGIPNKPIVTHRVTAKGHDAYYSPSDDLVNIPYAKDFDSIESYYSTFFHELVHATGHEDRLGRHEENQVIAAFGSPEYSREELVAEFGASMLCGHCGIEEVTLSNSTSYIASWLKVLKKDMAMLPEAIEKAFKSVEYLACLDSFKKTDELKVTEVKPEPPIVKPPVIDAVPEPVVEPVIIPEVVLVPEVKTEAETQYIPEVNVKDMKRICNMFTHVVGKRQTLPCLACLLVEGKGKSLYFTADNLEQRLTLTVPFEDKVKSFKALVEFKSLKEIVKSNLHDIFTFGGSAEGAYEVKLIQDGLDDFPEDIFNHTTKN